MKKFQTKMWCSLTLAVFLALFLVPAWSQQSGSSPAPPPFDSSAGAPPAATANGGPDIENPPLSGLDEPASEPAYGGRSYLVPGIQISESVNSTSSGLASNRSGTNEIARGLGSLDLQKVWKTSRMGLDYIAGGTVYQGHVNQAHLGSAYQVHTFSFDERILWRTGQFAFRDSFSFLPEGAFGSGSYGGSGAFNSGAGSGGVAGVGSIPGGVGIGIGSIGIQPRITNFSGIDLTQALSPRSTVVVSVGYNYTDFLANAQSSLPLINSQMSSAQIGYDYLLNHHDRLSATYAYQNFRFPSAGSGNINAHIWHFTYGHRVTGKLNLVLGGGPQLIIFHNPTLTLPNKISATGRAQLSYQASSRTSAQFSYNYQVSPGSGFFAGSNTNLVHVSLNHTLGRRWTLTMDGGYSYSSRLQTSLLGASTASHYDYWYVGSSMRRQLGRYFGAFMSYQYNDIRFNGTVCTTPGTCGNTSARQTGLVGIDWHPHPFRLD